MSPKEKAKELVNKFNYKDKHYLMLDAKQCALIAVDEVLSVPYLLKSEKYFYTQVKQEIEKL